MLALSDGIQHPAALQTRTQFRHLGLRHLVRAPGPAPAKRLCSRPPARPLRRCHPFPPRKGRRVLLPRSLQGVQFLQQALELLLEASDRRTRLRQFDLQFGDALVLGGGASVSSLGLLIMPTLAPSRHPVEGHRSCFYTAICLYVA
jgi:hypothetical protein